jgi:hypothetical protein
VPCDVRKVVDGCVMMHDSVVCLTFCSTSCQSSTRP